MRLVFVNNIHPDTPHVSGTRLSYFAREMALCGHEVVLVTGVPPNGQPARGPGTTLDQQLGCHDWSRPMILGVAPRPSWSLEAIRGATVPPLLRRGLTAWNFVAHGGVFGDWTRAAAPVGARLAEVFRPDLVWATFGNTSNLALAQGIARRCGCLWVADVKDNWEAFVPVGLQRLMARRFRDAAGVTSNAAHHLDIASRWLDSSRSRVVYSGVAEEFFAADDRVTAVSGRVDLLLIGSTYSAEQLEDFLTALRGWLIRLAPEDRSRVRFVYAGSDHERVAATVSLTEWPCERRIYAHLPIADLAHLASHAFANCYLWSPSTFHHKLLELLVVGRPVVAFSGEHEESRSLASQCATPFSACENAQALQVALERAWADRDRSPTRKPSSPAWHWSDFAVGLEQFFLDVAGRPAVAHAT